MTKAPISLQDLRRSQLRDRLTQKGFLIYSVRPRGKMANLSANLPGTRKKLNLEKFLIFNRQKGEELYENPNVALVFYWAELERHVRIAGTDAKSSREESAAYFALRPRGQPTGRMEFGTEHCSPWPQISRRATMLDGQIVRRPGNSRPAVLGRLPRACRGKRILAKQTQQVARPPGIYQGG